MFFDFTSSRIFPSLQDAGSTQVGLELKDPNLKHSYCSLLTIIWCLALFVVELPVVRSDDFQ